MTSPARRERRLYKDPNDKTIAGVASGVAKYFEIDTTLVRAIWFVLAFSGFGILLYVILWIVLEDEPAEPPSPPTAEAGTPDVGVEAAAPEPAVGNEPLDTDVAAEEMPGEDEAGGA